MTRGRLRWGMLVVALSLIGGLLPRGADAQPGTVAANFVTVYQGSTTEPPTDECPIYYCFVTQDAAFAIRLEDLT
ncbi:MAG: hypothetical protein ACRD0U_00690, partial [Acidimicrobiales bacterium]